MARLLKRYDMLEKLKEKMTSKKTTEGEEKTPKKKKSKKPSSKEQIAELEVQLAEQKDKFLRLYAEFENYKKRTLKERLELMKNAGQETLKKILPVLDDFDRAKQSAEDENSAEPFSEGVILVYEKLNSVMKSQGVTVMETNGQDFDPELHAAISEIPAASDEMKGKIIDTVEKGYYLNDKIIRHAKVVVGK